MEKEINLAQIDQVFEQQQAFFKSGATRSYEFRIKQLNLIKALVKENEQAILDALKQDLGKHPLEAFSSEIGTVIQELHHSMDHLRQWMENVAVDTPLVHQPARTFIMHDPLGVVLIVAPWNYPFMLCITPLISAIAAGNCVFIKPSNQTKATSALIQRLISKYFKPEYMFVVEGPGAVVGTELISKHRFDRIFFTGSKEIGIEIMKMAAEHLSPVTLELGGKSPAIVDKNVNIQIAAKRIVWGKFWNAGQTCVAPDYVLVHESIYDEFIDAAKTALESFFGNNPQQSESFGRIVNQKRLNTLKTYLSDGEIICGGTFDESALYFAPTLMKNINLDSSIMKEEIFGPILPIISYSLKEDVLKIVDRNPYPLACYLFTKKQSFEKYFLEKIRFGGGAINIPLIQFAHFGIPLGGVGFSGMGSYHGKTGFDTFSHQKPIIKTGYFPDIPLRYAPYMKVSKLVRWLMS